MSDDSAKPAPEQTPGPVPLRPARRVLHVCYCCNDADAAAEFFVDNLAMINVMSTPMAVSHGSLLGMEREIESRACFVYDRRGPRVSPSIEVQHWKDPAALGTPSADPFEVGIKALGYTVADLGGAIETLVAAGCTLVTRTHSPFDGDAAVVLDPTNTTIELAADSSVPDGESRMHHLRITVTSLEESLPFYDSLGFDIVERGTLDDASFTGHAGASGASGVSGAADAVYAVLRLPDEAFQFRLIEWRNPSGHGRHYAEPWHAGIYRVALGVDDTRASYDAMSAQGSVFDRPPRDVELNGTPVPNMWITFISDPDGIPYEFVQRPRSAFR